MGVCSELSLLEFSGTDVPVSVYTTAASAKQKWKFAGNLLKKNPALDLKVVGWEHANSAFLGPDSPKC